MHIGLAILLTSVLTGSAYYSSSIDIIEVITRQNRLFGYSATAPAFDVAFDQVIWQYPLLHDNVRRTRISRPEIKSCSPGAAEAVSNQVVETVSNASGFSVLVSPSEHATKWHV